MAAVSHASRRSKIAFVCMFSVPFCALVCALAYWMIDSDDPARSSSVNAASSQHLRFPPGQALSPRQRTPVQQRSTPSGSPDTSTAVRQTPADENNVDIADSDQLIDHFVQRAKATLSETEIRRFKDRSIDGLRLAMRQAEDDYINATEEHREEAERRYDAVFDLAAKLSSDGPSMSSAETAAYRRYHTALADAELRLREAAPTDAESEREAIKAEIFESLNRPLGKESLESK